MSTPPSEPADAGKSERRVSGRIRAGMPASDSVRDVVSFTADSKTYRILKTTERDAYDPPSPRPKSRKKAKKKKSKKRK